MSQMEYFDINTYHKTIEYLRSRLPVELHQVKAGIICGSGLGGLVKCFDSEIVEVDYKDIPFFAQSTVAGHAGKLVFGWIQGLKVVVMVFYKITKGWAKAFV
jgi:purine-nucleoside phosphorylase